MGVFVVGVGGEVKSTTEARRHGGDREKKPAVHSSVVPTLSQRTRKDGAPGRFSGDAHWPVVK